MSSEHRFRGIGGAFFPEHHPASTWPEYVALMREVGLSFVRMAEFAWDKLEPEEGRYEFGWLDEVFGLLGKAGVDVMLCTPTAVPPIWAVEKYPEICPVTADGKVFGWGIRRYTCPTSPAYRSLSAEIVGALADHYGPSPQVMGWQIDNEIGHPFCYCDRCRRFFQDWCRDRFRCVEHFNDTHGAHFLGQTVQGWHQIPLPNTYPSPSLWMSYHRFFSEMTVDCFGLQARVLREHGAQQPITTNMMVTWGGYDHEQMAAHLDVIAGDAYTLGDIFGQDFEAEAWTAAYLRGLKPDRNIWYNEMQWAVSGGGFPLPGQTRWWTLLRAGLGADVLNFFRWDTSPSGLERDILGLLKPSRQPGRIFGEVKQIAAELAELAPLLDGTAPPPAPVGVLYTYENHWEFAEQRKLEEFAGPGTNGYALHLAKHFRAAAGANVPVEVVYPGGDFGAYQLLIAPALYVLSAELGAKLAEYVRQGGTLLLTCFSGLADENAKLHGIPAPGPLREVCGVRVLDYGRYHAAMEEVRMEVEGLPPLAVTRWVEEVLPDEDTEVLGSYAGDHFVGVPVLTRKRYGEGEAYYLGTLLSPEDYGAFYGWLLARLGIEPIMDLPADVHVARRARPGTTLYFLSNDTGRPREVSLAKPYVTAVSGVPVGERLRLEAWDVQVLRPAAEVE